MEEPRLVPVGKIGRVHGVRGAVRIYAYGESLAVQDAGERLYLRSTITGKEQSVLTLVSLRPQGRFFIGEFRELDNAEDARKVVGSEIFLPEEKLPPTSEDEYYHYQLVGLAVETLEGGVLGILRRVIETGSNDVYVVEREGKEVLIPALEEVICRVDLERGRMIVNPPEGLMDDL